MPAGDGSGPRGQGPMSGKGFGPCGAGGGRFRRDPGRGRGFGRRGLASPPWQYLFAEWEAYPDPAFERDAIEEELRMLSARMEALQKRLDAFSQASGREKGRE